MRTRHWLRDEIDRMLRLMTAGHPARQIAQLLDRTESSIRYKMQSLGLSSRRIFETENMEDYHFLEEEQFGLEQKEQEKSFAAQMHLQAAEQLQKQRARKELRALTGDFQGQLLEQEILEEFRRTVFAVPPVINVPPLDPGAFQKHSTQNEVAVAVISDSHVGQVVDAREIDAALGYNPAASQRSIEVVSIDSCFGNLVAFVTVWFLRTDL